MRRHDDRHVEVDGERSESTHGGGEILVLRGGETQPVAAAVADNMPRDWPDVAPSVGSQMH